MRTSEELVEVASKVDGKALQHLKFSKADLLEDSAVPRQSLRHHPGRGGVYELVLKDEQQTHSPPLILWVPWK